MTKELIRKTKEGVKVFLIVEKVWTKLLMKKAMRRFRNSNVVILYASDLVNIEMHRTALFHNKIWVFDQKTAIVGGQNIIQSENISSGYNHQNYDLDLLIEGPAVTDIARHSVELLKEYHFERKAPQEFVDFIENYEKEIEERYITETMEKLRGEEHYKDLLSNKDTRLKGVCRFVIQGPHTDRYAVSKAYIYYFKKAKYLIDLTTGKLKVDLENDIELSNYTGWSKRIWSQLRTDADNGIKINLINNGIDGGYGELSSYLKLKGLKNINNKERSEMYYGISEKLDLKAAKRNYPFTSYLQEKDNIEVWNYFQYMHAKSWMIDRFVVSIGSFNLDNWSSDRSQESVLICQDKKLAGEYEIEYTLGKVNSTPVYVSD
jgi:phosphatidylserine/phosphatidylglycerophosphate/cardiolipin synthase-like enzyme